MVVPTDDLAMLDGGFADDASEAIPTDDAELIPEDGDVAALSGLDAGDAAASDVPDDQADEADPDPTADLRQQLAAAQADFDSRFREFQQTKDREIAQTRNHAQQVTAFNQSLIEAYIQRMTEAGLDQAEIERDLDAMQGRTQRRVQQQAQSAQQTDQQFMGWAQGSIQRMKAFVDQQALADDGVTRLFDPAADADLSRLAVEMYENARKFNQTGDEQFRTANQRAYEAHRDRVYKLREEGIKRVLAGQRQQKAAQQQKARQAQAQRGRQVTTTGGGGGAPTADQLMTQAEAVGKERGLDPVKDYSDIYNIYLSLKYAQPQQ